MSDLILLEAAQKHGIAKGLHEQEQAWAARIVYSICGMMAYTSLLDESVDELSPISKINLKRRVQKILDAYISLYPYLKEYFAPEKQDLSEIIYQNFLDAGIIYSSPFKLAISKRCECRYEPLTFSRGISPDEIALVSGVGFYTDQKPAAEQTLDPLALEALKKVNTKDLKALRAMFGLETDNLKNRLLLTLARAVWHKSYLNEDNIEYLRVDGAFTKSYWVNKDKPKAKAKDTPPQTIISEYGNTFGLLTMIESEASSHSSSAHTAVDEVDDDNDLEAERDGHGHGHGDGVGDSHGVSDSVGDVSMGEGTGPLGELGEEVKVSGESVELKELSVLRYFGRYYLYLYRDKQLIICPLPMWMVEAGMYRTICCAILKERGILPPIDYTMDGKLVHVRLNYLLPHPELKILRLYSWPESMANAANDFARCLSTEVFYVLKDLLIDQGYEFQEGLS